MLPDRGCFERIEKCHVVAGQALHSVVRTADAYKRICRLADSLHAHVVVLIEPAAVDILSVRVVSLIEQQHHERHADALALVHDKIRFKLPAGHADSLFVRSESCLPVALPAKHGDNSGFLGRRLEIKIGEIGAG